MARKKKDEQKKLILKNGDEFLILGENSRFWLCKGTQFRKKNPAIQEVQSILPEAEDEAPDAAESEIAADGGEE